MSIKQAFDLINGEDTSVASAVADARAEICQAINLVVHAIRSGGRLIYVGAGTSGRLGVLDATECPPTFLTDPSQVVGLIAGGHDALTRSIEGTEDNPHAGRKAIDRCEITDRDVVFGIATGGTTPFVHGAIERAKELGAITVFLACVSADQVSDEADVSIRVITGPEVVTGSTRMKAGTATKMVLNMITTITMVQLGKVYGNLMVDVNTQGSAKLRDRGVRILQGATALPRDEASSLLDRAEGQVKAALVMHEHGVDIQTAQRMLSEVNGMIGQVLSPSKPIG